MSKTKNSTYARLLKPGDKFYVKGDYKTYTVVSINVQTHRDDTPVVMEGKEIPASGELMIMVWVHVQGRSNALTFDGSDRVELVNEA